MLEVRLIGKFEIKYDGKLVIISSRPAQSLFAYLILTAGTLHRREKLAGMFWPDATEEKARAYLRHELWRVRKALPLQGKVDYLIADDINISFDAASEYWSDVATLENVSESASIDELKTALSVFQGELLPGFYDDWIILEREHLQAIYEQKINRLLEMLKDEQRWNDILEWAERWISFGQVPEAAFRYLMMAYDARRDPAKVASTYERCAQALCELNLEPSEETRTLAFKHTTKLHIPIPLTSFIGREKEVKEVVDLLSKSRLVTLTGSGGVGKTRLGIQVVANVLEIFPDGMWFLDLAPLSDPALIPNTLAGLLGLRESRELPVAEILINYFCSRVALVIFDNCEHLIASCAQLINSLLTSCEHLSILATSRESLRISGEIPYRVPSLTIPKLDIEPVVGTLMKTESVRLFTERAVVASSGFAISLHNVFTIAQICQRLDGIPLAIELAAARINVLTVEQILKRLDDRFDLLTGGLRSALPRHQTLRATIGWSYDLLSESECILFRRLTVFMGGWTLEAAEEVCSGDDLASGEVLELLFQLINKSLVIAEETQNGAHYRTLDTIRQYANEKLEESGERDVLRDRHLEYFLNLAETAEPHLIRAEQIEWLPLLDADYENLRCAFEWALSRESPTPSLRLCKALGWFWEIRCYWLEGLNCSTRALEKPMKSAKKDEKVARARALYTLAMLEWQLNHWQQILAPAQESLALSLENSDRRDVAIAKYFLAGALFARVDHGESPRALLKQSYMDFEELNEPFWQARVFSTLGYFLATSDKPNIHESILENIDLARRAGERLILADALSEYADWLFNTNQVDEAKKYAEESERLYTQIGSENTSLNSFLFAAIAWNDGDLRTAKSLYTQLEHRFNLMGAKSFRSGCLGKLGLLSMEEGDLDGAQMYFEEGLILERELDSKPWTAFYLMQLGNLSYLRGNIQGFKEGFRESFSLKNHFSKQHKTYMLMTSLHSLCFQRPESAARLLGVIDNQQREFDFVRSQVDKRNCNRAEAHIRSALGDAAFESVFADGQKMPLDEALDLALKTVEEM